MSQPTKQQILDEITNDTENLGYKNIHPSSNPADWKTDQVIADLMNAIIPGNTIVRLAISSKEICYSIVMSEVSAISDDERFLLKLYLNPGIDIDATVDNAFTTLTSIFDQGTMPLSRALLLGKIRRDGSRAETLWGEGTSISAGNVGQAAIP